MQLDETRADRLRDAHASGVRAGEKHAVHFLCQQGGADLTAPDQRDEHVRRHTRFVQQPVDVQARERGELRRFVEHRVAGQQGRHEHVAAHEIRVVPGRDVGHHAERVEADDFTRAAFIEHLLRRKRGFGLRIEKVDAREQTVDLVA